MTKPRRIEVASADRADWAIASALGISRSRALLLLESGGVRSAGRRLRKGARLEAGSVLEIAETIDQAELVAQPEQPLHVLLEAPGFVVLDKPAGMACHPLRPGELGTLANALVARFPECGAAGASPREGGLCHRLDRETSGTILAARWREAFDALRGQFRRRTVQKIYLALVRGRVDRSEGSIELPLGGRGSLTKPWRGERDGRSLPALTFFRELWAGPEASLLEVRIETGVRHQIRAHLAALGHPLWGDAAYGGGPLPGLSRHLLHAWRLGFEDPVDGAHRQVTAPLPDDAQLALERIGAPRLD